MGQCYDLEHAEGARFSTGHQQSKAKTLARGLTNACLFGELLQARVYSPVLDGLRLPLRHCYARKASWAASLSWS